MGGQDDLAGDVGGILVVLLDELRRGVLDAFFPFGAFQQKVFLADEFAVANKEHLDSGGAVLVDEGDHVLIGGVGGDDLLALDERVHGLNLIPQAGGLFELQVLGGVLHLLTQLLDKLFLLAVQEERHVVHHAPVLGLVAQAGAGGMGASAHVVIEARALLRACCPSACGR